jgi:uncharacterized protein YbbC (DUF1343 family)
VGYRPTETAEQVHHMKTFLQFIGALAIITEAAISQPHVKVGADLLFEKYSRIFDGKRIGVVTNHSAILSSGRHLVDVLVEDKQTTVVALFGPEHGIRGDAPDGRSITHGKDAKTGIQIYSLYGATNKPTDEMLKGIDLLIYDIQDVGVRFYTYESTLSMVMEASAEHKIPIVVLDRPNPIRGTWVEGFVRLDSLKSFVGLHPTPMAHGLTIGELANMINGEGWLANGVKAELIVVKMEGWNRSQWFDETGLTWIKPSPNMASLNTAIVYPGMCLVEGTNLSEGRGTSHPFETIGAPFVNAERWSIDLNALNLPGVVFRPVKFVPNDIPGVASNVKHRGLPCEGVQIEISNRDVYQPVGTAVSLLSSARKLYPNDFKWRITAIDRLSGTPQLRLRIDAGESPEHIAQSWEEEAGRFVKMRKKYLLY